MNQSRAKMLTAIAMLSAMAYLAVFFFRIPIVVFLKYEPKDVIITIGGFIYGPIVALMMSFLVSFIEMLTISTTGFIGFVMNFLSSAAFACTAAFIYRRHRTFKGAVVGLALGTVLMTGVMILWNYLITPLFMNVPRKAVVEMLIPVFLPFNLLKGGINTGVALLLYKPLVTVLRRGQFAPGTQKSFVGRQYVMPAVVGGIILATSILLVLSFKGII